LDGVASEVLLSFGWPSSFFVATASFLTAVSILGGGLVLAFLSSLAIVFPNADLSEVLQIRLFRPRSVTLFDLAAHARNLPWLRHKKKEGPKEIPGLHRLG
jgi:hypothetical protein